MTAENHTPRWLGIADRLAASGNPELRAAHRGLLDAIAAHRGLLDAIAALDVPYLDVSPSATQFRDVAEYVRAIAGATDAWLKAVGAEVRSNAISNLDTAAFDGVMSAAIGAIESAAESVPA